MIDKNLELLAEDFFKASLESSPTSAIMRGRKEYFDQIEELTEEKFEKEIENVNNFKQRLSEIDFENLSSREKVMGIFSRRCWFRRFLDWLQPANVCTG